ncbi:hypothetical protein [Butyribacter sp.]|uniref:hypothetical protein n=1 Tax=Butyribacter sp. TaxID=2822465 RepID=UPI002A9BA603|nr:hypothetical protein [Butyribacter sp.]
MKTEFIPKFITLLAGAVISIVCIVKDVEVTRALEILLVTLILFYIIGCLVRRLIERVLISNSVLRKEIDKQTDEDIEAEDKEESDKDVSESETEKTDQDEN